MPAQTLSVRESEPLRQRTRHAPKGVSREDSDDELGSDDLPWEWIYEGEAPAERRSRSGSNDDDGEDDDDDDGTGERKRRKVTGNKIVGAHMGTFECRVGDCVLLKAEGSNEAWVGLICEFVDDEDGDMAANFMWFSTEQEIRNKDKKRTDFYWVCPPLNGPLGRVR